MTMRIGEPQGNQIARCLELLQRSNQFNLSARRYSKEALNSLLADPDHRGLAFTVADRFGDYGLVGFAVIRNGSPGPTLIDFVMSCRVAQKRVEEAFLLWYAGHARKHGAERLWVELRETESNGPLREALMAIPLEIEGECSEGHREREDLLFRQGLGERGGEGVLHGFTLGIAHQGNGAEGIHGFRYGDSHAGCT